MAVYTPVSRVEIEALLAGYSIGLFKSLTPISDGVENSNYLLETTHARYVVTIFEARTSETDLPYFIELKRHLATQGVPVPTPIEDNRGRVIFRHRGKAGAVFRFLSGTSAPYLSSGDCAKVGEALARLHNRGRDFVETRRNAMGPSSWRPMWEAYSRSAPTRDVERYGWLRPVIDTANQEWPVNLPVGTIHADLFPDNVLFEGGEISGLLDFYFACDDYLAYDLAVALVAWCFAADNGFDGQRARSMVQAYNRIHALTHAECCALPRLLLGAALRFSLSRLVDSVSKTAATGLQKDPEPFLTRVTWLQSADAAETVAALVQQLDG